MKSLAFGYQVSILLHQRANAFEYKTQHIRMGTSKDTLEEKNDEF
jgi:hypothetical protein